MMKIITHKPVMLVKASVLLWLVVNIDCLSLDKVSDKQNVTKRAVNNGDFYPDWVPFKNKHGEELGEFVQVDAKAKPKKRLALPVNFKLKAAAEPEVDNNYDNGQENEKSEDSFEKKEKSDVNKSANAINPGKPINHTDISDIDGVVKIITKVKPAITLKTPKRRIRNRNGKISKDTTSKEAVKEEKNKVKSSEESNVEDSAPESSKEIPIKQKKDEKGKIKEDSKTEEQSESTQKKAPQNDEDDVENEDGASDKEKQEGTTDEEKKESEARKAMILDSVDELKARHEKEQRAISEKVKEEEIYKEEHERNKIQSKRKPGKYSDRSKLTEYNEYDDNKTTENDKYTTTTTIRPRRNTKRKTKNKKEHIGKLSVFKNPRAYVNYDESNDKSTTKPVITKPTRYSSRYTAPKEKEENVRISLVPEDLYPKRPAFVFPQKKKNKRRRKQKSTTTPSPDSSVAESVGDTTKDLVPAFTNTTSVVETAPSAIDAVSTNSDSITDAVPASTDKKEEQKSEDYDRERGGAREYKSEHYEVHDEHGKKAYEGIHKDTKTAKGHHDKEDHHGKYDDHGGFDKEHHDEALHYGAHHHEEHGKKQAKYEESGKHSKGHSTKGSHDIHKKEEYEKKVEFFEEEGDSSEEEKHGGHNHEREHSSGGHFKHGNLKAGHHGHSKGDTGHFQKGGHEYVHKGHKAAQGHDGHGQHGHAQFSKGGKNSGKKWVYHHGYPAKDANLVAIDRRADQYYHGPQYYG